MDFYKGKTDCAPEEVGYDSSRLAVLNDRIENFINDGIIQGSTYCISRYGKTIAHGAMGKLSYSKEDTRPIKPDTIIGIASITKTFATIAIMQLVEDGLINLNEHVGNILPQMNKEPYKDITIFQLLTHTSGLAPDMNCFPDEYAIDGWDAIVMMSKMPDFDKEHFDWLAAGLHQGLRKKPGHEWQYCSFGFVILGEIISKVTGIFANDYIAERICKPLGMNDSGFVLTKEQAQRHIIRGKEHEEYLNKIISGEISGYEDAGSIWEKVPDTAGGMFSTAADLVRYANMLLNGGRIDGTRMLGKCTLDKMVTQQFSGLHDRCWGAMEDDRKYGIGFDMRTGPAYTYSNKTFMHEGAGACSLDIDPETGLAAAWFVPFADDNWHSEPLYNLQNIIWSGIYE